MSMFHPWSVEPRTGWRPAYNINLRILTSPKDQYDNQRPINDYLTSLLLHYFYSLFYFVHNKSFFFTNSIKGQHEVLTHRHNSYWGPMLSSEINFRTVHLISNKERKTYVKIFKLRNVPTTLILGWEYRTTNPYPFSYPSLTFNY